MTAFANDLGLSTALLRSHHAVPEVSLALPPGSSLGRALRTGSASSISPASVRRPSNWLALAVVVKPRFQRHWSMTYMCEVAVSQAAVQGQADVGAPGRSPSSAAGLG